MFKSRFASLSSLTLIVLIAIGWAIPSGVAAPFKAENKPENLKAFCENLQQTIHVKKDGKVAAEQFRSLQPDEARAKKALKDDAGELAAKIGAAHEKMTMGEAEVLKLTKPEQTVVQVHAATTEAIAKYEQGTPAADEFPGGAKALAEQFLRPGMTFYEVEFLEPGKDAGMKFHLFYWDGNGWAMLGPMWRLLK